MAIHSTIFMLLLGLGLPAVPVSGQSAGTADGPRLLGPRRDPGRSAALRRFGGSSSTEKAVLAGLDWLARHQEPDGRWDADAFFKRCESQAEPCKGVGKGQHGEAIPCPFDHAISALATLAFLGHAHLPGAAQDTYGALLKRSLTYLRSGGDRWGYVIATQVLAEAEALEQRGRFMGELKSRVRQLLRWQGEDGAWGYARGFRRGSDVPFSAFVVQALVASRDAGIALPGELAARVDAWLSTLEIKRGRLAYLKEGRRFGYTPTSENAACAAAMRALLEIGTNSRRHRLHLGLLAKQRPTWKLKFEEVVVPGHGKQRVQIGHLSLYRWWYGTIATFQAGGGAWSGWNGRLKSSLLKHQKKRQCARGSWDPDGLYERQTGGRVFATALGVLMLEQPYRHRRLKR